MQARVAERLQVSRATVSKWVRRYPADGVAGLADRSSTQHRSSAQTAVRMERWSDNNSRTASTNQIHCLLVSAPDAVRQDSRRLDGDKLAVNLL